MSSTNRMCEMYPDTGDIAISVKTGATEAMNKLPAILDTSLSCIQDVMVFSDLNQTYGNTKIHDVLSRFSPMAMKQNKDFDLYRAQLELQSNGMEDEIEDLVRMPAHVNHWATAGHNAPWALDKYKFIHMLEMAYELQPGRAWYLFIEPDTYLSWPNLKRWIKTLNPTQKLFFGNAIQKSDDREPLYFAHGGSGFLISSVALKEFAVDHKGTASSLDSRMHEYWAGDFTVADTFYDNMGLKVTNAAPMLGREDSRSYAFGEGRWCQPVITLHHMQAEDFKEISAIERTSEYSQLLLRDVYQKVFPDGLPSQKADWDNVADAKEFALNANARVTVKNGNSVDVVDPHSNLESCRIACEHNEKCFQFTWRNTTIDEFGTPWGWSYKHSCVLSSAFRLGSAKPAQEFWANLQEKDTYRAWHSGWLNDRINTWVSQHRECPSGDHWTTDNSIVEA